MLRFKADKKERLDKFLALQIMGVSRAKIQKSIKHGKVLVNGKVIAEADFKVSQNDQIELPEFLEEKLQPTTYNLQIVFENQDLAVIDKPAGLVVHPGAGHKQDTLSNALLARFPGIEKVGAKDRPGIVHRLDEDTSGLIVVAKMQSGYNYLRKLFDERKIEKEYLALVHGVPQKRYDVIDLPLAKESRKQRMKVGSGKDAITEYWVLESLPAEALAKAGSLQYSLLRVKLHTGRTHQVRAHLSHIGHPLVGDSVYGAQFAKQDQKLIDRQFLHAHRLKFQLSDGTWLELMSELPDELTKVLARLGISYKF